MLQDVEDPISYISHIIYVYKLRNTTILTNVNHLYLASKFKGSTTKKDYIDQIKYFIYFNYPIK
jgi:hypothetical protein